MSAWVWMVPLMLIVAPSMGSGTLKAWAAAGPRTSAADTAHLRRISVMVAPRLEEYVPVEKHGPERGVAEVLVERPARAAWGHRIERERHVSSGSGRRRDVRRAIRREPVVRLELDVDVVEVLVEEKVQPGLDVPAVGR